MRVPKRGRRSRALALTIACLVMTGLLAGPAGAAPSHKSFAASITPDTITAGTEADFELTVTNTSTNTALGAVRVTVPSGFMSVGGVAVDLPGWSVGGTIEAGAGRPGDWLAPGESVVISFTATTPLQNGDTDYTFGVEARQANNFNGPPGNDLNLVGGNPVVSVTGTAVACNPLCETNFSEAGTSVKVNSQCESADTEVCGILVTDLDEVCPEELSPCIGRSAFWKPPSGATEPVSVRFAVPTGGTDGFPDFWVQFENEGPVQCTLIEDSPEVAFVSDSEQITDCTYTIEEVEGTFVIEALVNPKDPRGFAS